MAKFQQITSSVFLLIFCIVIFNYLLFSGFIKFKKSDFRKELISSSISSIQEMEIAKADIFKNKNGIEWKEHHREVVINGSYYEVIKIEQKQNTATLYIIKDEKENKLFASFFSKETKGNNFVFCVVKLISALYIVHGLQFDNGIYPSNTITASTYDKSFVECNYHYKIIKPPRVFHTFTFSELVHATICS